MFRIVKLHLILSYSAGSNAPDKMRIELINGDIAITAVYIHDLRNQGTQVYM